MSDLHEVNALKKTYEISDKKKIWEIMTQRMQISQMFITYLISNLALFHWLIAITPMGTNDLLC